MESSHSHCIIISVIQCFDRSIHPSIIFPCYWVIAASCNLERQNQLHFIRSTLAKKESRFHGSMVSIFCCQCEDEFEEYPTNAIYRQCVCLRFFFHQLFSGYGAIFQRIEGLPVSSSNQGTTLAYSGIGTVPQDMSLTNQSHSISRPLPYEADQRFIHLQRGLVSRREKTMSPFQEDSQTLRRNMSSSGKETSDAMRKLGHSEDLEKGLATKSQQGLIYVHSSDNEDVCPTCLDEYTTENPKIVTRCSHHFHLGCIYEWMERSDSCPMCGKEMEFSESP